MPRFFSPYYHVEATYSVEAYTCLGLLAGAATCTADAEGNTCPKFALVRAARTRESARCPHFHDAHSVGSC